MISNVLLVYFDPTVDQQSRTCQDLVRVVKKDEKGEEVVTYEPFDSASYQKSLGFVSDWSLNSLLSAGIDPRFVIKTGFNQRLEGLSQIEQVSKAIESVDMPD